MGDGDLWAVYPKSDRPIKWVLAGGWAIPGNLPEAFGCTPPRQRETARDRLRRYTIDLYLTGDLHVARDDLVTLPGYRDSGMKRNSSHQRRSTDMLPFVGDK